MKIIKIILLVIFFSACTYKDEFYFFSKEEIMLRSSYIDNSMIVSYVGAKDGYDYIIFTSKYPLKQVFCDSNEATILELNDEEKQLTPYANNFLYFYKATCLASKNKTMKLKIINEEEKEYSLIIQRLSKSLNYHL